MTIVVIPPIVPIPPAGSADSACSVISHIAINFVLSQGTGNSRKRGSSA